MGNNQGNSKTWTWDYFYLGTAQVTWKLYLSDHTFYLDFPVKRVFSAEPWHIQHVLRVTLTTSSDKIVPSSSEAHQYVYRLHTCVQLSSNIDEDLTATSHYELWGRTHWHYPTWVPCQLDPFQNGVTVQKSCTPTEWCVTLETIHSRRMVCYLGDHTLQQYGVLLCVLRQQTNLGDTLDERFIVLLLLSFP